MNVSVAIGTCAHDIQPKAHDFSWPELADRLLEPPRRGPKDGPYFQLVKYADGAHRELAGVESVAGYAADIDRGDWSPQDIESAFAGCQFAAWETHSSEPGNRRWRVVVPFTAPVGKDMFAGVHIHFSHLLGDDLGEESGKPAQLWYLRSRPLDVDEGRTVRGDGELFDAIDFASLAAPPAAPRKNDSEKATIVDWNAAHDVSAILEEHGYERVRTGAKATEYLRPGSTSGSAGCWLYHDTGHVYAHSGGDPLGDGKRHDAFDCMRILDFNEDWAAAFRHAETALGIKPAISTVIATDPTAQITLLSVADMRARPRPSWRIKPLLLSTGLAVVYGASGAGKTFCVLDMVLAIVRGTHWFGHRVKKGRVVYVAAEGALWGRLDAYMRHHNLKDSDLDGFVIVEQAVNLLDADGDLDALIEAIRNAGDGVDVVVIDTLNRAMGGGDENGSQDMGRMVDAAKQIETAFGCAVLYVHHSGKDESKGSRGHSSLKAASDSEISVKGGDGPRVICAEKVREGESGVDVGAFTLEQVDLGATRDHDPDADESERDWSCVIAPCKAPSKGAPILKDSARKALDHFHRVMDNHGKIPPAEAQNLAGKKRPEAGQTGCPFEVWRTACISSGSLSSSDKPDTHRTAFSRALKDLEKAGVLVVSGGWVWLDGQAGQGRTS